MRTSTREAFIEDLDRGTKYEQFIYDYFQRTIGKRPNHFKGKDQQKLGENNWGLEIKYDHESSRTGNLYIETQDKVNGGGGIYRVNNTRYLLIGDYSRFWIFSIEVLRELHTATIPYTTEEKNYYFNEAGLTEKDLEKHPQYKYHRTNNPVSNSRGYLLPIEDANRYAKVVKVII